MHYGNYFPDTISVGIHCYRYAQCQKCCAIHEGTKTIGMLQHIAMGATFIYYSVMVIFCEASVLYSSHIRRAMTALSATPIKYYRHTRSAVPPTPTSTNYFSLLRT